MKKVENPERNRRGLLIVFALRLSLASSESLRVYWSKFLLIK